MTAQKANATVSATLNEEAMGQPAISVVIPVFNEQENVLPQSARIVEALQDTSGGFEVWFVDDGSTDETADRVELVVKGDKRFHLLKLPKNKGQTLAMETGLHAATGQVLVTLDGDCQHDPADIAGLVSGIAAGADMVCGYRKNRQDPFFGKKLPSLIFNAMLRMLLNSPVHDNSCTLRAYRPEAIRSIKLYFTALSFIPVLAVRAGYVVTEMVVRHCPRKLGQAKYDSPRRFVYTLIEMVKILAGKRDRNLPEGKKFAS